VKLHVSNAIAEVLETAASISARHGHFYVGVEHVFTALLEHPDRLPKAFADTHLSGLFSVGREVTRTVWGGRLPVATSDTFHSPRCIATIGQAGELAKRLGGGNAQAGHLLLALLEDPLSAPSRALDGMGLKREKFTTALRHALQHPAPAMAHAAASTPARAHAGAEGEAVSPAQAATPAPKPNDDPVSSLTRDLTALARQGKLETTIGRDEEILSIFQILARKTKNNVMIVGEAGVGKSQLVEGLALRMSRGTDLEGMPRLRILELSIAALMAGTQYRGVFEEKVMGLIDALKGRDDVALFIDEVHLIMGAGSTQGDGLDLANLLKPVLARGEIRCIGATTLQEYRKFVEKDPAIERRFQMVRVEELSQETTLQVLRKLRPSLEKHHGVRIGTRAMEAAVQLTVRYMPNRQLPDKAIDVIDEACARYRLRAIAANSHSSYKQRFERDASAGKVTPHEVRQVVSQVVGVPLEELTKEERLRLADIDRRLARYIIGQDEAISRVVSAVKKSRAGLADPNRPDAVLLFLGPTGVGKTRLAKVMADVIFGSPKHLVTFDMSEYIEAHSVSRLLGAPPGYVGSEEEGRLSQAVRSAPFSILLFDEIEKAHERIFDIFLPVFEEGRIKDSRGRDISFRNNIIVLTSNVGAEMLGEGCRVGEERLFAELRRHFRPEFINRIDEIVPFYPLLSEDIRSILRLEVNALRSRVKEKRVGIRMYQRAYEYLAGKANTEQFGAREVRRVVDQEITSRLSDLLLTHEFKPGDMIDVKMEHGELVVTRGLPHGEMSSMTPAQGDH
jgi:ATP-dependent Clp protease ATP-binding subunit ClpC